jgi:hypothetical protein
MERHRVNRSDDSAEQSTGRLRRHCAALGNYVRQMTLSHAAGKSPSFDAADVLTEIARAASTCGDAIMAFDDDDPLWPDVLKEVAETQHEIAHATHALVLMLAALRKQT